MNNQNKSSNNAIPQAQKRLHFGLGLWRVHKYYKTLRKKFSDEGVVSVVKENFGRRQMKKAALYLKPIVAKESTKPLEIHFLTGKKYWYQTVFCAYSLAQQAGINIRPVVYDDDTLSQKYAGNLLKVFPDTRIVSKKEIEARLDKHLPLNKFPVLRQTRTHYFHLRKLTDIHAGAHGWNTVLDSDMLFYRYPAFLLNWLQSPQNVCYMKDVRTAYGYNDALLISLTKTPMLERVNAGLVGLNSDEIDWEQLEFWCKSLIENEGVHFFLEQALVAMYLSVRPSCAAPEDDYVVFPKREEIIAPSAVLHHYVGETKAWYFQYGWRHVLRYNRQNANDCL